MKKIKLLTIILGIVLVTMIAFFGVYVPVQNRMENKVKDYDYAMDLKGGRNIRLSVDNTVDTVIKDADGNEVTDADNLTDEELAEKGYIKEETPRNSEEVLTEDNYKKSKEIIEKRLNNFSYYVVSSTGRVETKKINNYIVKLDETSGDILVEIPENDYTDIAISSLGTTGKFQIVDSQTQEVLMDNNDIKSVSAIYGSNSTSTSYGTTVYLDIEFSKEGTNKLKEISNTYVESNTTNETNTTNTADNTASTDNTTTDENSATEETKTKEITMKIDDEEIMTTSFDETIETGRLQLSIGSATTDYDTIEEYLNQASSMAVVLDNENMPVKYTVEGNQYILSDITQDELNIVLYVMIGLVVIALIVLIIRYRTEGLVNAFAYVGLAALFVLLLRYTNVIISIESIFGIAVILVLNYIFENKLLYKIKKEANIDKTTINIAFKETYKEFFIKIIPICIAVITFCFIQWEPISSFGMVMFWGILLIALYNFAITYPLVRVKESKGGKNKDGKKQAKND